METEEGKDKSLLQRWRNRRGLVIFAAILLVFGLPWVSLESQHGA